MKRIGLRQSDAFLSERLSSFLFVFCLLALVLCGFVGLHLFWSDSEMWPIAAVRNLWLSDSHQFIFVKPLFNFLLWCCYQIALSVDQVPMDVARLFMAINLVAITFLVFRIIKKITANEVLSLASAAFLLLTITMLEQGTRVRSDLLVCSLNLLTLDFILHKKSRGLVVWIPALLSLLITPKAIYWILALLPLFPNIKEELKKQKKYVIFPLLAVIFGALIFHYETIFGVARYFFMSFTEAGARLSYFNHQRFEHVVNALKKDLLFWFLIFIRLFWVRGFKSFDAVFVILLAALMIHPERMPFFIVSLMPFFLILAISHPNFSLFFEKIQTRGRWIFIVLLGIFFSLLFYRYANRSAFLLGEHNNSMQRQAVHLIQDYILQEPSVTIYDPAGIIYKAPTYDWFIGPAEIENNIWVMSELKRLKPDIILYSVRSRWLEPELYQLLKSDYVNLGGGVFGRFPEIPLSKNKKYLQTDEIIAAFPMGKTLDNPQQPVKIFAFDPRNQEISANGSWLLDDGTKLRLSDKISFELLQAKVLKVELPKGTVRARVSFWNTFSYTLPSSISVLFRFDPEL